MSISQGEKKIISILRAAGINFVREKSFKEAVRVKNCRFDFFLPQKNILLECDGAQHFIFNPRFFKNQSEFLKSKERDRMKNSAALAMGIPLYRIPYWEIDNLKNFEDLLKPEYLVRSKFHNDEAWRAHQNRR